jgi:pyruvate dehydrogenase E2 component (dihydrolipoamide acetyltransferase)
MLQRIILPQLGQTMEEGTIEKWHKKEGDIVKKGEVLYDLGTDKATLEVESFAEGTLRKVLVAEGQTVPVNRLIAIIGPPDEEIPDSMLKEAPALAPVGEEVVQHEAPAQAVSEAPAGRTFVSPRARKLAEEQKVPLKALRGSGPGGRVVERDVEEYLAKLDAIPHTATARAYAFEKGVSLVDVAGRAGGRRVVAGDVEAAAEAALEQTAFAGERLPLSHMRRTIAARMTQSKQSVPHFYLVGDVMMGAAIAYAQHQSTSGAKVTLTHLLVKAVALALRKAPRMNARFDGDAIVLNAHCNVGVAVAVEDGLFVPVVRNADEKSLGEIGSELRSLADAARQGRLIPEQYEGGSITISNLGMFGVQTFLPIINSPESCIVGVGAVTDQVVAVNGGIRVEPVMAVSVSADHRVADGVAAAQFFSTLKALMEKPEDLG